MHIHGCARGLALCGLAVSALSLNTAPARANDSLVIWNANKAGDNGASFRAGVSLPMRFDPTVTAETAVSADAGGGFDPHALPLSVGTTLRLTTARAESAGRSAGITARVNARTHEGAVALNNQRTWLTGSWYELKANRVLTARVRADDGGAFAASQSVELSFDSFDASLSTVAGYDSVADSMNSSVRVVKKIGDGLSVSVSVDQPQLHWRPALNASYSHKW